MANLIMVTFNSDPNFPYFFYLPFFVPYVDQTLNVEPQTPIKKFKRTWTRDKVAILAKLTEDYIVAKQRPAEALDIFDFQVIAASLPQTPAQCYAKMKEVYANGTIRPGVWSAEEDSQLIGIVSQGVDKWKFVATRLNYLRYQNRNVRTGKQCKERWNNHLNPALKHGHWTAAEDLQLLELHRQLGTQWSKITKQIGNRNVCAIKNRVKGLIHKEMQYINLSITREEALQRLLEKRKLEVSESARKRLKVE